MKRLFTILALALALPAFGQKVKDFPNRSTLASNDLFSVSANAGAGTYHVSFGQITNELGGFFEPKTASGAVSNSQTTIKAGTFLVGATNYSDTVEATNHSYLTLTGGGVTLQLGVPSGSSFLRGGSYGTGAQLVTTNEALPRIANALGAYTNDGSGNFGWFDLSTISGGGGGGGDGWFWGTNTAAGTSYTNKWGVQWDQTGHALRFDTDNYIVTDNYWHFSVGIANHTETSKWDDNGDFYGNTAYFTYYGSLASSYSLNLDTGAFSGGSVTATNLSIASGGSFSTPELDVQNLFATNIYPQGLSSSNTFLKINSTGNLANAWDGNGLTNIAYTALVDPTNVFYSTGTLNFAVPHSTTNMSGNLTITAVANVNNTNYNIAVVEMLANGADRTITLPTAWRLAPYGGTTITVTNGTSCKLTVELQVNYFTNAYASWAY